MLAKTFGSAVHGVDARTILVEVNVDQGTRFYMSGLPDNALKESQLRIESTLKHYKYFMPRKRTVVNLAPADIRKEGSAYDLPIALCVLEASGQITTNKLDKFMIMGELSLDGELRPIKGVLPIAIHARKDGFKGLIIPASNAREAAVVDDLDVIPVKTLRQAIRFLEGKETIEPLKVNCRALFETDSNAYDSDFKDVQGQENIKRALEIAASGGHNVITL